MHGHISKLANQEIKELKEENSSLKAQLNEYSNSLAEQARLLAE